MMIREVCLYLTRRCNIRCRYCRVPRRGIKNELSKDKIFDVLRIIKKIDPEILVLFGGEPLLRKDFREIVDEVNNLDIPYTVITNGTRIVPDNLKSLTCSVDTLKERNDGKPILSLRKEKADLYKAVMGKRALVKNTHIGDRTANVILTKENYLEFEDIVRFFDSKGIWIIAGIVHSGDGEFRFKNDLAINFEQAKKIRKIGLKLIDEGLKIHNIRDYFEGLPKYWNLSWHCSKPDYLIIDCDGKILACNDVFGQFSFDIFSWDLKKYKQQWIESVKNCSGCYYNHKVQLEWSEPKNKVLTHDYRG